MKLFGYIVVSLLLYSHLFSQTPSDSVVKRFPEVNVESKKELSNQGINYMSNQVIDGKSISTINPIEVTDVLQYISGVNIRDYGGLSSIKTISLRGLPSNQTLMLIDGLRITNSQTGITDVSSLFVNTIGRVEVVKGSASSQYGSNAMAGAVNMITKTEIENSYKLRGSYDNFTNKILSAEITQNIDSVPFNLNVRKTDSEGNYNFRINDKELERLNSHVNNTDFYLGTVFNSYGFTIKPKVIYNYSDRGSPEPVIAGIQRQSNANLREQNATAIISSNKYINDSTELKIGAVYNYSDLRYRNSNAIEFGSNGLDNSFYNSALQIRVDYNSKYKNLQYSITTDANSNFLNGDMLQRNIGDVKRSNIAFAGNINYTKRSVVIEYSFFGSFRGDYSTDFSANYSPMIGLSAEVIGANLTSKFSISTGYRLPSFNEMYYLNYGNTDLQSERSITYNLGFDYEPKEIGIMGVNLFYTNTNNQIAAVPTGPITWQSQNIDKVNTKGVEFFANLEPIKNLNIIYNYIYQQPNNISDINSSTLLPYTPEEIITGLISYEFNGIVIGVSAQHKSFVFTTIDNDFGLLLNGFTLFDSFVSYRTDFISKELSLRIDLKNITDKQYQLFINYPMPGRNVRGTISYEI